MTLKGHLQEIGRLSTLNYNDYTTFKFSPNIMVSVDNKGHREWEYLGNYIPIGKILYDFI